MTTEHRPFERKSPFDQFIGKETRFRVEARGSKPEIVVGTPSGVAIELGSLAFVVLDGGRRMLRASAIVDARLQADYVAERDAHPFGEEEHPGGE